MIDFYDKINATIDAINAVLGGGTVDQIIKKSDSVDFNTLMTNSILPDSGTSNLKIKVIEIGDWNMDSTSTKNVSHGLSDHKKIRSATAIIRPDDDGTYHYLGQPVGGTLTTPGEGGMAAGIYRFTSTLVQMLRADGSVFDDVAFDSTSFNRGFITIIYEG